MIRSDKSARYVEAIWQSSTILILVLLPTLLTAQQYGWRVIAAPRPGYQMKAVEFKDSLHGWCDAGGLMFRTTDGGHSWDTCGQPYLTNGVLDISFSDTLHGWAVATVFQDEALIWRTVDGGVTWIEQRHDYFRDYNGTAARSILRNTVSGNTHYTAARDTGKIAQTTNGGQLWIESINSDSVTRLRKIQFIDSLHGWMNGGVYDPSTFSGSRNVLFSTKNGGAAWHLIDKPVGFFSFVDTLHGFAYGGRNTVGDIGGLFFFRTQDGGLSWDSTFIPDTSVYSDQISITAVSFVDTLNGWLFGSTFYQGESREIILRTTDGGTVWTRESVGLTDIIGDAKMIDKYHGWTVALDGQVLGYELITGIVEHLPELPSGFILRQNYPNPFNNSTVIEYEIPKESDVHIAVYDGIGKFITALVDQHQEAGVYRFQFDATGLSSGVYFYRMEAGTYRQTQQLQLVK